VNPFFQAIFYVAAFTLLFVVFYLIRLWIQKKKAAALNAQIKKNGWVEARKFNQTYLASLAEKIKSKEIYWFEVCPSNNRMQRLLVSKSPEKDLLVISFNYPGFNIDQKKALFQCGAIAAAKKSDGVFIELPFDNKSLADCIYFIFEKVMKQENIIELVYKVA